MKVALGLLDARHIAGDADARRPARSRPPSTSGGAPRPPAARAAGGHRAPAGRPTASWRSCWRATSRRPPAGCATSGVLRGIGVRRGGRRAPAGGPRRPPPPARRPRRAARRPGRRVDRLRRPGTRRRWPSCWPCDGRRRAAAPGLRATRRTIAYALRRRLARGGPVGSPRRRGAGPRHAGPPPGRPRRGRAGRRGGARPDRGRPAPRPEPVAAGGRRRGDRAELPIARATLEWLAAFCPPLPRPWPAAARAALLTLLGAGPGAGAHLGGVRPVRAGRPAGCRSGPGCAACPQHNPVHRFTLGPAPGADGRVRGQRSTPARWTGPTCCCSARSCTTSARACRATTAGRRADRRRGRRPDRAAAGRRGDRGEAGPAAPAAARRGHPPRPERPGHHRHACAEAVGDAATLDLLHALARADAAATGPAAWSDWKGRLMAELVAPGARRRWTPGVAARRRRPPTRSWSTGRCPPYTWTGDRVAVAAADRRGLLAAVAGCLALHRLDVVAADATTVDGRALVRVPGPAPLRQRRPTPRRSPPTCAGRCRATCR